MRVQNFWNLCRELCARLQAKSNFPTDAFVLLLGHLVIFTLDQGRIRKMRQKLKNEQKTNAEGLFWPIHVFAKQHNWNLF